MPTKDEHIDQALRNETLADRLDANLNPTQEWRVTLLFYAALHWVEAYLTNIGMRTFNHSGRQKVISQRPELTQIVVNYFLLKHESEEARYNCKAFAESELSQIRDNYYNPVKQHMQSLL